MTREQELQQQIIAANINRVCQGSIIIGNIETAGDIRLDGVLEGNIISKGKVVIGNTGKVKGDISCRTADVFGEVKGDLTASDFVNLKNTAMVKGDITTGKLSIETGATFNGACKTFEESVN